MKNPLDKSIYLKRTFLKDYPIRGDFFRDQTAIIHSMPYRRLKHKTQVFFSPENDHVCTRIEHVMHVATIGATICKGLNKQGWKLNVEMPFCICGKKLMLRIAGDVGKGYRRVRCTVNYRTAYPDHGICLRICVDQEKTVQEQCYVDYFFHTGCLYA